jgi:hypothetical protein
VLLSCHATPQVWLDAPISAQEFFQPTRDSLVGFFI